MSAEAGAVSWFGEAPASHFSRSRNSFSSASITSARVVVSSSTANLFTRFHRSLGTSTLRFTLSAARDTTPSASWFTARLAFVHLLVNPCAPGNVQTPRSGEVYIRRNYNGPTKLDTKTARFKLHLRAWDGFGSSTHQVSRQRLFWNCSKKRVAYRSCRRSMGSILRNFTGGARRRWKSCRRFSPENPVGKKRRPVTMNASTSSTPKLEGSAPS